MAKSLYVGVSGVARKIKSNYTGVSAVARKVKSGYVGVSGVARQCFSSDATWTKYNATSKLVDNYTYTQSSWTSVSGQHIGEDNPRYGSASYKVVGDGTQPYKYGSSGGNVTVVNSSGFKGYETFLGPCYQFSDDYLTVYQLKLSTSNNSYLSTYKRTITSTWVSSSTVYTVGTSVGTVQTTGGAKPDSENGYTYVTVYNGYTIMKDPSTGKFYAYLEEV